MQILSTEIKQLIIHTLNLEDLTPEQIDDHEPLFNEGLGLDSIDALELGLALKSRYNIVLSPESEDTKKHFYSIASLVDFVNSQVVARG